MTQKTDWKKLTCELAGALHFALQNLDARGTGLVMNMETGKTQPWQRYLAESLAKVPGVVLDWEAIDALSLPAKQKRAYFAKRRAEQSSGEAA